MEIKQQLFTTTTDRWSIHTMDLEEIMRYTKISMQKQTKDMNRKFMEEELKVAKTEMC